MKSHPFFIHWVKLSDSIKSNIRYLFIIIYFLVVALLAKDFELSFIKNIQDRRIRKQVSNY